MNKLKWFVKTKTGRIIDMLGTHYLIIAFIMWDFNIFNDIASILRIVSMIMFVSIMGQMGMLNRMGE